jgi:hypothetical protein
LLLVLLILVLGAGSVMVAWLVPRELRAYKGCRECQDLKVKLDLQVQLVLWPCSARYRSECECHRKPFQADERYSPGKG